MTIKSELAALVPSARVLARDEEDKCRKLLLAEKRRERRLRRLLGVRLAPSPGAYDMTEAPSSSPRWLPATLYPATETESEIGAGDLGNAGAAEVLLAD